MALGSLNTGKKVYLVDGRRSPFGKFGGSLKSVETLDLCLNPGKDLLNNLGIDPSTIDHTIIGNVIPPTTETIYVSRHLGLSLGLDQSKGAYNVNRLCGSGIQAILDATRMIKLGEAESIIAGGVENMSMIPHLVYGSRFGTKYGSLKTVDMLLNTLTDNYTNTPMGVTAENMAKKYGISRSDCDAFSMESHKRAAKASFENEITAIELKRGTLSADEHIRADVSIEEMNKLKASFVKDGVVTAATASGIVDGAALVLVASEEYVSKHGLKPIAQIIDGHVVGVDPNYMGIGPVPAINKLLEKNKLALTDIGLFEINEAFAAQVLSCTKEIKVDLDKVNVWGGSIAIGHPLGATGVRISHTLARQMQSYNKEFGIASACIGGGQGISLLLKNTI